MPFFEKYHIDDLRTFSTITTDQQIKENRVTSLYKNNKYRIPLNQHVSGDLFHFLEREDQQGGACIRFILQTYCKLETSARGPITPYSFEAISRRTEGRELEDIDAQEGIPGINIGLSNRDVLDNSSPLKLGPLPMEDGLREDVRSELLEEDQRRPPRPGQVSLTEEFDQKIKREETDDTPSRADLPLPPSRARDVLMEMQKVRENRDRFKIEGRSGGIGPGVSCCMFTLHNTLGR
jgi:transcription initiation factor TFIID subunit 5